MSSYQQKHWNALLLYNYFSHIINDRFNVGYSGADRHILKYSNLKTEKGAYYSSLELTRKANVSEHSGLKFVADQIKEYYEKHYKNMIQTEVLNKFLDKAVYDLDRYFVGDSRGLDVYAYLKNMKQTCGSYYSFVSDTFARDKKVFIPRIYLAQRSSNDNSARYRLTIMGSNTTFKIGNDTMSGSTSFTITDNKITGYTMRRKGQEYKLKVNPYFEIIEMEECGTGFVPNNL